jgi:hopene-associated glycosyltransferase HpnB
MTSQLVLALAAFIIWVRLIAFQGGYWRERNRDDFVVPDGGFNWPDVAAVVPARNEADVIANSMAGLIGQNYPGRFDIILVDDQSTDGTADIARQAASSAPDRLHIISGTALPAGWVGKMWAVHQGIMAAEDIAPIARYVLLTDADIGHEAENLTRLVLRAEAGQLGMVSQMVRLKTDSWAEKFLIPAFVYFFAMLYPFAWVNDKAHAMAAAAGGAMLVRRSTLKAAGGIEAIRNALIDDCALAARIKAAPVAENGLDLSLTGRAHSLRSYGGIFGVGAMISRSAFTQLNYSWGLLIGTILGMALTFLAPVCLSLSGGLVSLPALSAFGLMILSFGPILEVYELSALYALALPLIAVCYSGFTLKSAFDHANGRGGLWKGRVQAGAMKNNDPT